ncbi:MAG: hypothetical protein WDO19_31010 [Bacteroidota bacterium]
MKRGKEMNMKIDRHNYEEFFLLYVDNELTAEQKNSVHQFIQENPDLARELEILQQVTLKADDAIVFDGKEMLLRKETDSLINMTNYEEYLIAYIDNELTDAERIEFFKFAAAHPPVKEELDIYQQTKLQPEKEIVFANKEVLYRREEKVRVITMQWWKVAVAAAVILAIGITTITVLNKPAIVSPGVADNKKKPAEKTNQATKTEQAVKEEQQKNPAEIKTNTDAVASTNTTDKKGKNIPVKKVSGEKIQKNIFIPEVIKDNNESVAKKDVPVKNDNIVVDNKSNDAKIIEAIKKSDDPVQTHNVAVTANLPKEINSKSVTPDTDQPYNNKETAQENTTNENAVYASYDEGKNKKTRGFFRKAARVFERRTNISASDEDNNDKVLIGALAVKLK